MEKVMVGDCCSGVVIVTENINGEKKVVFSSAINSLIDDWEKECDYLPETDAPVYFAMVNNAICSQDIRTIGDIMEYLVLLRHEEC